MDMIGTETLITGGIGIITTIASAWTSWIFARKKYNSEVDHNLIENMEQSLEFYKKLSDDNRTRLEEMARRNDEVEKRNKLLELEVQELRKQMLNLTLNICMDLTCINRIREEQLKKRKHSEKNQARFNETKKVKEDEESKVG